MKCYDIILHDCRCFLSCQMAKPHDRIKKLNLSLVKKIVIWNLK